MLTNLDAHDQQLKEQTIIDNYNPVIQLCNDGMSAEAAGRLEEAHALFQQAWDARQDAFDACVAAHYLARGQDSLEMVLYWNNEALQYAKSLDDERVQEFYPSLYLNLGQAYAMLDNRIEAGRCFDLALAGIDRLLPGPYRTLVQHGIIEGRERIKGER